jgi:nitroreductase
MSADNRVLLIPSVIVAGIGLVSFMSYLNKRPTLPPKSREEEDDANSKTCISASDALHLIQTRRSIFPKQYSDQSVPSHIISDMLEAARWAPTHNLTEPWRFIVFQSESSRKELGQFLATQYKNTTPTHKFVQSKYEKKMTSVEISSHVIAICVKLSSKNPMMEDICSVAMAVQNMHLIATAHGVGAYWSTGGIYDNHLEEKNVYHLAPNPPGLKEYLNLEDQLCIGWFYVGSYLDTTGKGKPKSWPSGRRKSMDDDGRVIWR